MLLFMLASGLTLILSMMGVLNFAHASAYMLGAYFRLHHQPVHRLLAGPGHPRPLLCGLVGAQSRCGGCGASIATAISPNCCSPSASP